MIDLKKESTLSKDGINQKYAEAETLRLKDELYKLQNVFWAEQKHSLLIILQGVDASGKDGAVRHVFSCMNPMGVNVKAFKAPTPEELSHDFLWRVHPHTPSKGMIQIFNRSHYEDILVPRAHRTMNQKLLNHRYDIINSFEKNLHEGGTVILKFFLHISKQEQKRRIAERLTNPRKLWKYDPADETERPNWNRYMKAYADIFKKCGSRFPWVIIPSDDKWYRDYLIAKKLYDTLIKLNMKYPSRSETGKRNRKKG
jgi:PPK2 family polyphosphate:nucleotide phosphotransferase